MSDPVARLNAALDPIIKDRVTFVRTSEETDGEYSKIVVHLSPGGGNEPHFHTSFGVNPCRWTGGVAWIDQSAASSCMNTLELLGRHVAQRGV